MTGHYLRVIAIDIDGVDGTPVIDKAIKKAAHLGEG